VPTDTSKENNERPRLSVPIEEYWRNEGVRCYFNIPSKYKEKVNPFDEKGRPFGRKGATTEKEKTFSNESIKTTLLITRSLSNYFHTKKYFSS